MKRALALLVGLLVVVGLGFLGRYLILGKVVVAQPKPNALSWAVQQSLHSSSSYQPIEGKDYRIAKSVYFDSSWAVVTTDPLNNYSDTEIMVLEKNGTEYKTVLGPGNSFAGANLSGLPADVARCLGQ